MEMMFEGGESSLADDSAWLGVVLSSSSCAAFVWWPLVAGWSGEVG